MEITKVVKPSIRKGVLILLAICIYGLHRKSNQKIIQNALISIYLKSNVVKCYYNFSFFLGTIISKAEFSAALPAFSHMILHKSF